MSTSEDYKAKAAEALVQLAEAKTEAERTRIRRAHGVYLKLSNHGAEEAARAEARPPKRIVPDKAAAAERSEEHTCEIQSLMHMSCVVCCMQKKQRNKNTNS